MAILGWTMTLIEFLNDIYRKVRRSNTTTLEDFILNVERDPIDEKIYIYFASRARKVTYFGKYKTNLTGTSINIPYPFSLNFNHTIVDTLKVINAETSIPHIEHTAKFVDDFVYDMDKCGRKLTNKEGKIIYDEGKKFEDGRDVTDNDKKFGIRIETKNKKSGVSTSEFHKCFTSGIFLVKDVLDKVPYFNSVDFSTNFSSGDVKKIIKHFDKKSILDTRNTSPIYGDNIIYFRRNSEGKLFLEATDLQHSYSVHTNCNIEEDLLYIPIRIRMRDFLFVLKVCYENKGGVTIGGKTYLTRPDKPHSFLNMTYEDDFVRFEYWIQYYSNGCERI